jgi:hypothetical protein
MSLVSTASPWGNDNNNQTKKRTPTISRSTMKIRPNVDRTNIQADSYESTEEKYRNILPESIDDVENHNEKTSNRVNELLKKISSENTGNKLADFKPIDNPELNIRKEMENREYTPNELLPKTLDKHKSNYSPNDTELVNYSNYKQTYDSKPFYQGNQPYYTSLGLGGNPQSTDKISEKMNYMIHLLEQQQSEKTANITEEFVLYTFLGVFVIYVLDSFTRAGRYVR